MFATSNTIEIDLEIEIEEQNDKENFEYSSRDPSNDDDDDDDDDDDAQSSCSDCMIIDVTRPSTTEFQLRNSLEKDPIDFSMINVMPETLPNQTKLLLIYENRIMDVQLFNNVHNLSDQQRLTISHSNSLYSIPKRHLFLSMPCNTQYGGISRQTRVMFRSKAQKSFSLGFIEEMPSVENDLRHLIVFDDGTASYSCDGDLFHLCLCQNFEQNIDSIEPEFQRENLNGIFFYQPIHERRFHLEQYVRVKKFDQQFHNAQIIDIDNSLIKVKFYQRQAQTEICLHQRSSLIDSTFPIDVCQSTISRPLLPTTFYQNHQCSPLCVLTAEEHFNPRCITQNPYQLPMSCGWSYFHIKRHADGHFHKKPSTHKSHASRTHYLYRSPCGRSFVTLDEVQDYLFHTDSKLTIKYFIDDRTTDLHSKFIYNENFLRHNDFSRGKERVPISVYNDNNENLPDPFQYGTENRSLLTVDHRQTTNLTCCSCTDNCRDRMKCECWLKTFRQAKCNGNEQISNWKRQNLNERQMIVRFGYNFQRLKTDVWSGIYECNSKCSCHRQHCTNRLVQNGLFHQLQLFHTEKKGWGLRVLNDIPSGSFINAYSGELITEEMAAKRDYKYLASLDHKSRLSMNNEQKNREKVAKGFAKKSGKRPPMAFKSTSRQSIDSPTMSDSSNDEDEDKDKDKDGDDEDDACFILDAKNYGSISRFYNHSCKPNVYTQNVFIESHDPRFPVIALFACRTIRAGEEICWDYNYKVGCMPDVRIDCQCQASNCRGRLL